MKEMLDKLLAQGIDQALAESIISSFKPKVEKAKKKSGWHPGMESSSTKHEVPVDVYTRCVLCGDTTHKVMTLKIDKKSEPVHKTCCGMCDKCPAYLDELTKEQLISLVLLSEKGSPDLMYAPMKTKVRLAKRMTPAAVIIYPTEVHHASETTECN
jgi:hypothetical protein